MRVEPRQLWLRLRVFRDDDGYERLYVREWSRCVMDPYVVIHGGSLATGACATRAGQAAGLTARSTLPAAPAPDPRGTAKTAARPKLAPPPR